MIIVDRALQHRADAGRPLRVGMLGAGFMARGVALQIATAVPGMELVAICNRHVGKARQAFEEAGQGDAVVVADSARALAGAIEGGRRAVTDDPSLLAEDPRIDIVLEVTGSIEHAARFTLACIDNGKHVALMNAELDGTVGPILKKKADAAGVIFTNVDGDQPGVMMNLFRFVRGLGLRPVMCGNIKGLHDPYRNPTTQEGFARRWGQNPAMVTSFADGTKISFEQAIVANGTGMRVLKRGMIGPTVATGTPIEDAVRQFPEELLLGGGPGSVDTGSATPGFVDPGFVGPGFVDYVVGAVPSPGVFVLGTIEHPRQRHYLNLYKLGEGPIYCFYTPYHLCHFEVPNTLARAALLGDAALAPLAGPVVEVIAAAKTDLAAGQRLDGLGEYMTYGLAENAGIVAREGLLPIGLAEGCRLKRAIARDGCIRRADVEIPEGRLIDRLRDEQDACFGLQPMQEGAA